VFRDFLTGFSYFIQGLPGHKGAKGEPVPFQGSITGIRVRVSKAGSGVGGNQGFLTPSHFQN
jgi:hypothetical protein